MKTHTAFILAVLLVALLHGCRSREAPAPEPAATPGSTDAAGAVAQNDRARVADAGTAGGYDVSDEEVRRATYLTRAALMRPGAAADDPVAILFGESGVRFARLGGDERFGQYACEGIDDDAARRWLDLAARELALHAPGLIRASGTRWVVFCRHLVQGGRPRGVVPAGSAGTLLLDATAFASEDFFRRTLHHELFHMLDFSEDGGFADAEWTALNAAGTAYGGGGGSARDASNALGSGAPGFVTEYAQAAVEEDKAEVFRFLALAPGELSGLGRRDAVVARKRDLLLQRLERYCAGDAERIVCREVTHPAP